MAVRKRNANLQRAEGEKYAELQRAHVEMMGLIGAGNNPMVGMTVAVAVSVEEAAKAGKF